MSNPYVNCTVARYHDFKVISSPYVSNTEKKQVEQCRACQMRKEYAFRPDGKMVDEQAYLMDHIRYFAQPSMGEVYFECNPGMKEKFALEAKAKERSEEFQAENSEKFKFAMKRAFEDKDDGITKKL